MGKKKDIPEFALDQNGVMKKVQPKRFAKHLRISDWRVYCDRMYAYQYNSDPSRRQKRVQYQALNYVENKPFIDRIKKSQSDKLYVKNNQQKVKTRRKRYYEDNKQQIIKKTTLRDKQRKQSDPLYKMKSDIKHLIICSMQASFHRKDGRKTFKDILKCTQQQFRKHIQDQFQYGMNWDNHGKKGWNYDHIIPIDAGLKCLQDAPQIDAKQYVLRLSHFTNFRPMWDGQNTSKGNSRSEELTKLSDERYNLWRIHKEDENFDFQI